MLPVTDQAREMPKRPPPRRLFHAQRQCLLAFLTAMLLGAGASNAGTWEDGYAAYQRKDYVTAVAKWQIVADSGDAQAQSLLGLMHFFGQGVPQNYPQAIKWLHLAAAQGEPKAQFKLGAMHTNGQGFKRDNVRAAMWFMLAAESGHPNATKALNKASAELSPAQIAVAHRLAQTCINRDFKDCD